MITVLTGGSGGARYLTGQVLATPHEQVTAVVNVADDVELHGLHISPDIDTVIYTLAGDIDKTRGWGLDNETWNALTELRALGLDAWFNLGDRDIGTHMFRTTLLRCGVSLSEVTERMAKARGLACKVLPVSNDPVRTMVTLASDSDIASQSGPNIASQSDSNIAPQSGPDIAFQEYFVRLAHNVPISSVRFEGAEQARPAPGVLNAIKNAHAVVIAPSNPVVSIGPLLAVPGIVEALTERRDRNVAVSPIIAGVALKGPADRMMRELGEEASVTGVARRYRKVTGTLVIDKADDALAADVEAVGIRAVIAPTIMHSPAAATELARHAMAAVGL